MGSVMIWIVLVLQLLILGVLGYGVFLLWRHGKREGGGRLTLQRILASKTGREMLRHRIAVRIAKARQS